MGGGDLHLYAVRPEIRITLASHAAVPPYHVQVLWGGAGFSVYSPSLKYPRNDDKCSSFSTLGKIRYCGPKYLDLDYIRLCL